MRRRRAWVAPACSALLLAVLTASRCAASSSSAGDVAETSGLEWLESQGVGADALDVADGQGTVVTGAVSASDVEMTSFDLGVAEEGVEVLEEYEARGGCVLAQSGYLDLLGRSWGCVIQGEGWVDICVVQEGRDGEGSTLSVIHMDSDDVARELEP